MKAARRGKGVSLGQKQREVIKPSQLEVEDFLMNQDSRVEMSTFTGRNRDRLQINLVFMSQDRFRNFQSLQFLHSSQLPCVHQSLFVAFCPTDTLEHVTQRILKLDIVG